MNLPTFLHYLAVALDVVAGDLDQVRGRLVAIRRSPATSITVIDDASGRLETQAVALHRLADRVRVLLQRLDQGGDL